jgi:inner membrane protein
MDSVSQAALGAAVGEALLGDKVGRRALLLGAVVGTLPDLDVAFYPLMDEIAQLSWHRGISHSLAFNVVFAPALGWLLLKINKGKASFRQWTVFSLACLLTAVLLDCFTVYGTQVFQPFSNYQVGFNSISIIDPLYTVPLVAAVVIVLFLRKTAAARKAVILMGLGLSTAYLGATLAIKAHVGSVVETQLEHQGVAYQRLMTTPTIFNTVLWRATAEVSGGYLVGYRSLFDTRPDIAFRFVPRNDELLDDIRQSRAVQKLLWFSNGWYTVRQSLDSTLLFSDLRFGEFHTESEADGDYIFTWRLISDTAGTRFVQLDPMVEEPGRAIGFLWDRMLGH